MTRRTRCRGSRRCCLHRDRTKTYTASFEEECGCSTRKKERRNEKIRKNGNQTTLHHKTTGNRHDHAYGYNNNTSTYARAGALVLPPPCLGGGITRVGPCQYPQYTRVWSAREAVGSSQSKHHRAPQTQPMSRRQHPTGDESLAW